MEEQEKGDDNKKKEKREWIRKDERRGRSLAVA